MEWAPSAKREPPGASAASNDHRPACRESLCACLARLRERLMQRPRCRLAPRQPGRQKNAVIPTKAGIHRALFRCRAEEKPQDCRLRGNDGDRASVSKKRATQSGAARVFLPRPLAGEGGAKRRERVCVTRLRPFGKLRTGQAQPERVSLSNRHSREGGNPGALAQPST
jgi:hypothetical protein